MLEPAIKPEVSEGLWHRAEVPPRLLHCRKGNWNGEYPKVLTNGEDWTFALITGPTGTGKSHLAVSELWRCGVRFGDWNETVRRPNGNYIEEKAHVGAIFVDVQEAIEEMKPPKNADPSRLMEADFLVFDDLGAERLTPFTLDRVSLILRHRYNHMRRTILTTNLTLEALVEVDPRLASRLLSDVVIDRSGTARDRRLTQRSNKEAT